MAKQFSYGGQAVIEGVMMRGAHKVAVAVRIPVVFVAIHFGFAWGFWKEVAKQVRSRVNWRVRSSRAPQPAGTP